MRTLDKILKKEYGGFDSINRIDIKQAVAKFLRSAKSDVTKNANSEDYKAQMNLLDKLENNIG